MIEFLFLLFLKHYVVDFILQTDDMVKGKGIYGNPYGILHSFQHGVGTAFASVICITQPIYWVVLPIVDMIVHYHVDYIKMKYGCRDVTQHKFWNQLGLDQFAHYTTYLAMAAL